MSEFTPSELEFGSSKSAEQLLNISRDAAAAIAGLSVMFFPGRQNLRKAMSFAITAAIMTTNLLARCGCMRKATLLEIIDQSYVETVPGPELAELPALNSKGGSA